LLLGLLLFGSMLGRVGRAALPSFAVLLLLWCLRHSSARWPVHLPGSARCEEQACRSSRKRLGPWALLAA